MGVFLCFDKYFIPFSPQEDCLRRLFEGLLIYSVLLKHVEKECPQSTIPAEVKYYSSILIREVERKVGLTLLRLTGEAEAFTLSVFSPLSKMSDRKVLTVL